MPLHWRPVGPEPASTYWLRRALLAAGVLVLLVLVPSLVGGGDAEPDTLAESPGGSPTASTSPSPSPSPSPSASGPVACLPTAIEVQASAEQDSYAVGGSPRLSLSITNTGPTPCTRDVGQAQVELQVTSGSDRIWSSDDCAPGGDADVVTLLPGEPVVQSTTWDGRRSLPDCAGEKAAALAGTYRVGGRLGDLRVEGDAFTLTG